MNSGKYVFAQLTQFLPQRIFDTIVSRYNGDKHIRHFSCWNQMLCMLFGQLTHRDSLRDLIVVLEAHSRKSYHLGLGKSVTRSNLSKANEKRNYRIFEEFAYHLISIARKKNFNSDFEIKGQVYAFDSSTIDLCLSVFWWATFRKKKAGIKLHTLYDVVTHIPAFIHITEATVNDMNAMDVIPYQTGAYYVFDRGYVDYARLYRITLHEAYFVVRAKSNLKFNRMYSLKVDKTTGVLCDQIGKLSGIQTVKQYAKKIRRVKYHDFETNRTFVFLTNNMDLTALQIALLYKNRWQVELFFKWIKQHLKVKSFWGTSENAVRIQIYSAIITYCLVAIVRAELKIDRSTYEILQVIGISLLDKTPINKLFINTDYKNNEDENHKQLNISWI
jgi:FOG: Transposase and inactivated derivatives